MSVISPSSVSTPICPGCSAAVDPEIAVVCDGCERPMHLSCLGLLPDEVAIISRAHRRLGHLKLLCADCSDKFKVPLYHHFVKDNMYSDVISDAIKSAISRESELLHSKIINLHQEVENLKLSNIDLVKMVSNNFEPKKSCTVTDVHLKPSYAQISQINSNSKVFIKPKDTTQSVHKTKGDIMNKIDPLKSNVNVTSVKSVSSGGVILTCNSVEADKLENLACNNLSDNYQVKKLSNVKPVVRIVGIPSYMDQISAFSSLLKQNENIFNKPVSEYKCIKFWETKKNKDIFQCIVQVDIDTYYNLKCVNSVLVGLNTCSVYDDVNVKRCYKCNAFNHTKKYCRNNPTCSFCAGSHELNDCALNKSNLDLKKCVNCLKLKEKSSQTNSDNIDCSHAAWEYSVCCAFKNIVNKLNKDVFGLNQESNFLRQ